MLYYVGTCCYAIGLNDQGNNVPHKHARAQNPVPLGNWRDILVSSFERADLARLCGPATYAPSLFAASLQLKATHNNMKQLHMATNTRLHVQNQSACNFASNLVRDIALWQTRKTASEFSAYTAFCSFSPTPYQSKRTMQLNGYHGWGKN